MRVDPTRRTRAWQLMARHPRAVSFVVTAAVLLALAIATDDRSLYGDAASYWSLARTFGGVDGFSLDGYDNPLRGYSFPLALYGIQQAAEWIGWDGVLCFRIVSAVAGAATLAFALPAVFGVLLGVQTPIVPTLMFCALTLLYWRGHFLYPLTDFPALACLAIGVRHLPQSATRSWTVTAGLVAGLCLAIAANARPIYAAALLATVPFVCWVVMRAATMRHATALVAFALGAGLALLPQMLINARLLGTPNPFAHSRAGSGQPNVYEQALVWGIAIQRYETSTGDAGFPVSVIFLDRRGQELLVLDRTVDPRIALATRQISLRAYGPYLLAQDPIFLVSAYFRHLFNGLDVAYATPYVSAVAPRSALTALVNYLILSLALLHVIRMAWSGGRRPALALVLIFLSPAILAIPSVVEPRYLLPLWSLAYAVVIFRIAGHDGFPALLRPPWLLVAVAILTSGGFALAAMTYAAILDAPETFDLWCVVC